MGDIAGDRRPFPRAGHWLTASLVRTMPVLLFEKSVGLASVTADERPLKQRREAPVGEVLWQL
jgi:hypothetical protein